MSFFSSHTKAHERYKQFCSHLFKRDRYAHVYDVQIDDEPSCAVSNRFTLRILLKIVDTQDNNISDLVNTYVFFS